jgi:uncharacterized membrane protein (TIGR02234 family)
VSTGRRELTTAVLGAAVAGALALVSGGQAWAEVTAERQAPLPPVVAVLSGADAAPLVPAMGLVLLAAAVALLAVRSLGRVVVGLLMAVAGGVLAWSGVRALTGTLDAAVAGIPAGGTTTDVTAVWPVLAAVAGVLGAATGLLVVLRGRTWPGMGRRYERGTGAAATDTTATDTPATDTPATDTPAADTPATDTPAADTPARTETDEDRAQAAWKALDRGEDPTA